MDIGNAQLHELRHPQAGRVEELNERPVTNSSHGRRVRLLNEAVYILDRQKPRQRPPRARRLQIFSRVLLTAVFECHEPVETPDRGDRTTDRPWGQALPRQFLDESIQFVLVQRVYLPPSAGGKSTKFEKIPLVTFKRMIS